MAAVIETMIEGSPAAIIKDKIVLVRKSDEGDAIVYTMGLFPNGKPIVFDTDMKYEMFVKLLG